MRLSLFDSDGGLGGAAAYDPSGRLLRDVALEITGNFANAWGPGNYANNAEGIQDRLNGRGWNVESAANVTSAWLPSALTYRVYAIVGTNYTDAQIVNQLRTDLAGYFNVNGTTVLSPPWNPVAAQAPAQN